MVELLYASAFFATAREREAIRHRRRNNSPVQTGDQGQPIWSLNSIFQHWRFCNVHREHDKTTEWFRTQVRDRLSSDPDMVIDATIAFRWFNKIETGERLLKLLLTGWKSDECVRLLKGVQPIITSAYMIKSPTGKNKLDGLCWCIDVAHMMVRQGSWRRKWQEARSLEAAHADLVTVPFLGPFLAYELVSDLRWTSALDHATDINTWASPGPGCTRGINRVLTGDPKKPFDYYRAADRKAMLEPMLQLLSLSRKNDLWPSGWRRWEMREVEHWLCEFDKYERVRGGERMKRRFP